MHTIEAGHTHRTTDSQTEADCNNVMYWGGCGLDRGANWSSIFSTCALINGELAVPRLILSVKVVCRNSNQSLFVISAYFSANPNKFKSKQASAPISSDQWGLPL